MNKTQIIANGNTSMIRPCFGPGMLLQHEDLEQIIEYTTGIYRLLFKSLLGPGVVCGLDVIYEKEKMPNCLTIQSGVAMDCEGYVIEVPNDQTKLFDECNKLFANGLIVLRRSKPKPCANRHAVCSEGMNSAISTREVEGFEILVVEVGKDELEEMVNQALNPFNGNECICNCGIGNGVMLASFSVENEVFTLGKKGRSLRIPSDPPKSDSNPDPGETAHGGQTDET